jgi:hypothetical protein
VYLFINVLLLKAGDAVSDQVAQAAAGQVAQAMQRQLKEDAPVLPGILLKKFVIVDPVAGDEAHGCATVTVFDPAKGFKVPAIAVVIVPSTEQAPIIVQRPYRRQIGLFDAGVQ